MSAAHESATGRQTVLFLQTHPSTFARNLGDALSAAGCQVMKINFCVGDWIYWLGRPAVNYRGRFEDWRAYLEAFINTHQVTDILYYGDCKPYHKVAGDLAQELGVRAMTYEFGYIRPDWITLERHGMSSRSHFPTDPGRIVEISANCPPPDLVPRYGHTMATELTHEVFYNLSSYFLAPAFRHYNADRYYNPLVEYLTGLPKQFTTTRRHRAADAVIEGLLEAGKSYYLFPLQLQCDYQLRHHAAFAHQADAIRMVIASFARNAAAGAELIFKCHPLDNDGENWPKHIREAAGSHGVADRVRFIDGGNLDTLLEHCAGCVLINSTVGMHALIKGCPTKVLGAAVFDIEGLTHQHSLDSFWQTPIRPDPTLTEAFVRALAGTVQIKGNFFTRAGQDIAIPTIVARLLDKSVNGLGAYVEPPPRQMAAQTVKK